MDISELHHGPTLTEQPLWAITWEVWMEQRSGSFYKAEGVWARVLKEDMPGTFEVGTDSWRTPE